MCKMSGCCISVLLGWGMLVSFNFLFLFVCLFVLGGGGGGVFLGLVLGVYVIWFILLHFCKMGN